MTRAYSSAGLAALDAATVDDGRWAGVPSNAVDMPMTTVFTPQHSPTTSSTPRVSATTQPFKRGRGRKACGGV